MRSTTLRWTMAAGAAIWLTVTAAQAQLGANALTKEQYQSVPEWKPEQVGIGETFQADLRPYLPPVGNQGMQMNSCTGWAVAYAAKTYLEVIDQQWRPDAPERQFSPAFLYNQLNGGRDLGSPVYGALELMKAKGCATLASMPYRVGDFTSPPSPQALREAMQFRIAGFQRLSQGWQMRQALMMGNPVVLVVYTDAVFNSGRYDVFTVAHRRQGEAMRQPGQPHGMHAMCAVGYDDSKQAFLIMNSWGGGWGQGGYCWVHYDLFKEIYADDKNMLWEAYVLQDLRQRMNEPPARPGPAVDRTVRAEGFAWYAGFRDGRHTWRAFVSIQGSPQAFGATKEVVWALPDGRGGTQSFSATNAGDAFRIGFLVAGAGDLAVLGVVRFSDNSTARVEQIFRFAAPAPARRALALAQTDRYLGRSGNQPYWEWTVFLKGNLNELADVQQVTYHLHPSFPDPNRIVRNPAGGFALTTAGWGAFTVGATVLFKDNSTLELQVPLKFNDPIRDQITLTNIARSTGRVQNNLLYYDWTAYLDGPLGLLRRIRKVTYTLHPTFQPPVVEITQGAEFGFPMSSSGWGTFTLRATLLFDDGSQRELTHHLKFSDDDRDLTKDRPIPEKGDFPPVPEKSLPPSPEKGLPPVPEKG